MEPLLPGRRYRGDPEGTHMRHLLHVILLFACVALAHSFAMTRDARPPKGFTALFNGRDLSGWKGLVGSPPQRATMKTEELRVAQKQADDVMRAHWRVEDGVLCHDGVGESLCTALDSGPESTGSARGGTAPSPL